ncbi:MAG: class I adenylate-forming enzyme family protein [Acidimicrobiia bacterium]
MDWLGRQAAMSPERPALLTPEGSLTYAELDEAVAAGVGALRGAGVETGDRVAVWGPSAPETVVALWAVPRAGAVLVPLDTGLTEAQAAGQVSEAGVRRALVSSEAPHLGVEALILHSLSGGKPEPGVESRPDRLHSIVFTSGSSGRRKGVLLSWGNLEASAASSAAFWGNGPGDRWLAVLPLSHVGGSSVLWRSFREGGAVILEPGFEAGRVAEHLASGAATFASLVPTMLYRLLEMGAGPFPGLRAVLVGGGPVSEDLLERAAEAGLPVAPTYGMTETASQVAALRPEEVGRRPRSSGRALPGAELRVVGEGRIEVRGPMVSPGYLGGIPRAEGAWLSTADLGTLDEKGYLTVEGRADDLVITGGEKVRPAEVEAVLGAHPMVTEVAVYGEDDARWGQVVAAAVVPAGEADAELLSTFARARLAPAQVPRRWSFLEELPRTPLGKLDRARLRERASPPPEERG